MRTSTFGAMLVRARRQKQISQHHLARRAGVSTATYQTWESGDALPSTEEVRMMFSHGAPHILSALRLELATAPPPPVGGAPEGLADPGPPPAPPPATTYATFGAALRGAREAAGLTVDELATLASTDAGLTGSAIRHWEHDTSAPIAAHYLALVDLLPALAAGPAPMRAPRDLAKPSGGEGYSKCPRYPDSTPEDLPMPTPPATTPTTHGAPAASDGLVLLEGLVRLARSLYPSAKPARLTLDLATSGDVSLALAFGSEGAVARGTGRTVRAALREVAVPLRAEVAERRRVLDELERAMPEDT